MIHGSHYPGEYTEAVLTAIGAFALSVVISYTPVGKQIDVPSRVVGGKVEVFVLRTAFALVALAAGAELFARPLLHRYDLEI